MIMKIIMIKIYYGVLENNIEESGKQKQIENVSRFCIKNSKEIWDSCSLLLTTSTKK